MVHRIFACMCVVSCYAVQEGQAMMRRAIYVPPFPSVVSANSSSASSVSAPSGYAAFPTSNGGVQSTSSASSLAASSSTTASPSPSSGSGSRVSGASSQTSTTNSDHASQITRVSGASTASEPSVRTPTTKGTPPRMRDASVQTSDAKPKAAPPMTPARLALRQGLAEIQKAYRLPKLGPQAASPATPTGEESSAFDFIHQETPPPSPRDVGSAFSFMNAPDPHMHPDATQILHGFDAKVGREQAARTKALEKMTGTSMMAKSAAVRARQELERMHDTADRQRAALVDALSRPRNGASPLEKLDKWQRSAYDGLQGAVPRAPEAPSDPFAFIGRAVQNGTLEVIPTPRSPMGPTQIIENNEALARYLEAQTKASHALYPQMKRLELPAEYDPVRGFQQEVQRIQTINNVAFNGVKNPLGVYNAFLHLQNPQLLTPAQMFSVASIGHGLEAAIREVSDPTPEEMENIARFREQNALWRNAHQEFCESEDGAGHPACREA